MAAATLHATRRVTVRVSLDLDGLRVVRDAIADALTEFAWSTEDAFRVLVCADEAFANVRDHGGSADGRVDIRFHVDADHARVIVGDGAPGRLPVLPAVPDEASEHGRGLILMDALADAFRTWRRPVGSFVAMHFAPSPSPAAA